MSSSHTHNRIRVGSAFGFTLVELLVVIGIIALLIAILMPALSKARESANRIACGSNLRSIGQGFYLYANDNKGNFPRGVWYRDLYYNSSPDTFAGLRGFSNPTGLNPFEQATNLTWDTPTTPWNTTRRPGDNDVTGSLFLLIRQYGISSGVFVCPSRSGEYYADKFPTLGVAGASSDPKLRSNFSSPYNLSYSVANMFPPSLAEKIGWKWNMRAKAGYALMADLNPGERYADSCVVTLSGFYGGIGPTTPADSTSLQRKANSRNHHKAGQNVLYADGHVAWAASAFAGYQDDNIYTLAWDNQWQSGACVSMSSSMMKYPCDSQMQPYESANLSAKGGLGVN